MKGKRFRGAGAIAPLLLAGCAMPGELRQPPSGPSLDDPIPLPDLPPYVAPIPHEAPRSDPAARR